MASQQGDIPLVKEGFIKEASGPSDPWEVADEGNLRKRDDPGLRI